MFANSATVSESDLAAMTGVGGSVVSGESEIRAALGEGRIQFAVVGLFSVFVNLLMLTGPVFMLQVYDRVLTSRAEATLVALAGIVAFLFLMMGLLDHFRARGCWRGPVSGFSTDSILGCSGRFWPARGVRRRPDRRRLRVCRISKRCSASPRAPVRSRSSTCRGRRSFCPCCSPSTGCWACSRCARAPPCWRSPFSTRCVQGACRSRSAGPRRERFTSRNSCGPAARRYGVSACARRCSPESPVSEPARSSGLWKRRTAAERSR